jgi:hypothetical protein
MAYLRIIWAVISQFGLICPHCYNFALTFIATDLSIQKCWQLAGIKFLADNAIEIAGQLERNN